MTSSLSPGIRPHDTVTFGRASSLRHRISTRTIALMTPILALTGCSLPTPGKATAKSPKDSDFTPSSSKGKPESSTNTKFYDQAMALNDNASESSGLPKPAPTSTSEQPESQTTTPPTPETSAASEPEATPTPSTPTWDPNVPEATEPPAAPPSETAAPTPAPPAPEPAQTTAGARKTLNLMSQNVWSTQYRAARRNWSGRMVKIADIAKGSNSEVIALQEAEPEQVRKLLDQLGSNFKAYPANYISRNKLSQRTILYQARSSDGKPMWELKNGGTMTIPIYKDRTVNQHTGEMPWARFVHGQTGQEVVVLSMHAVSWDTHLDRGGARKREGAGHRMAAWSREIKAKYPDALIVIVGDMNQRDKLRSKDRALGGNRMRTIPCIVGKELRAADDIQENRAGTCPYSNTHIDQVFTNSRDANHLQYVKRGQSDHGAVLVDLELFAKPD